MLYSLKLTMMIFLASFHSIDSYSALQHKRARFQDFADMLSTCNLWSQDYGATWRGHNANKLFIRNLFEVEVSLDSLVAMFV